MNTFLLFALIFIPFLWFIIRTLGFTKRSIGELSPLKTVVRYQVTARQHFTKRWLLTWLLMGLVLAPLPVILLANMKSATSLWPYALTLFTVVVIGYFLYQLTLLVQLHRRYWQFLKGVVLTLDPGSKTIYVERPGVHTQLNANTVDRIEHHVADPTGSKLFRGYGYYQFVGHDGQVVLLNDTPVFLYFAIEEYFKGVPQNWFGHKIPWPPLPSTASTSPNFAN